MGWGKIISKLIIFAALLVSDRRVLLLRRAYVMSFVQTAIRIYWYTFEKNTSKYTRNIEHARQKYHAACKVDNRDITNSFKIAAHVHIHIRIG